MKFDRTFNFSAGPAMMPEPVLEEIRDEMMNYRGSGMCVMEMSHRSAEFMQIAAEAEKDLRELMNIPENYKVLFIQGGATLQFSMIPMNLMKGGVACYVETGAWSKKAIAEAKKVGEVKVVASSKDANYTYIPDCSDLDIPDNADDAFDESDSVDGSMLDEDGDDGSDEDEANMSVGEKNSPFPLLSSGASVVSLLPDCVCSISVLRLPRYTVFIFVIIPNF